MSKKKFPVRVPFFAAGIRSQESRTGLPTSWWAKRWRAWIESMGLRGRLGRGRNYAQSGQVVHLEIEGTKVRARVQGSRREPYEVDLSFRPTPKDVHREIVAQLKNEPILLARLLVDDLPLEVESLFRGEDARLFPGGRLPDVKGKRVYDMTSACSCPDYANPCKHTCAVLLLLGEEIARRPLTLLELRGFSMEELFDEN